MVLARSSDHLNCSTSDVQCDRDNNLKDFRSSYQVNCSVTYDHFDRDNNSRVLRSSGQLNISFSNDHCDGNSYQGTSGDNGQLNHSFNNDQAFDCLVYEENVAYVDRNNSLSDVMGYEHSLIYDRLVIVL